MRLCENFLAGLTLALVLTAILGAMLGGACVAIASSACRCTTQTVLDAPSSCCASDDGISRRGGSCDCEQRGQEAVPLFPAPLQEDLRSARAELCARTAKLPSSGEELWRVSTSQWGGTGPPVHVQNCVWLI